VDSGDNYEIIATINVNVPMYKSVEVMWSLVSIMAIFGAMESVSGQYPVWSEYGGCGKAFRCPPLAVTWRTQSRSSSKRLTGGFSEAYDSVENDPY